MYALEQGLRIPDRCQEATEFLVSIMGQLEVPAEQRPNVNTIICLASASHIGTLLRQRCGGFHRRRCFTLTCFLHLSML